MGESKGAPAGHFVAGADVAPGGEDFNEDMPLLLEGRPS